MHYVPRRPLCRQLPPLYPEGGRSYRLWYQSPTVLEEVEKYEALDPKVA